MKTVKMQCRYPRCPELIEPGAGFCEKHGPADDHRHNIRYEDRDPLYASARWTKRSRQYKRENPICCGCGRAPTEVTDHIIPARVHGDFWDEANWQPLCQRCHNRKRQKEMRCTLNT
jgi:5-methylcytosine-specific restriction protein A